MLVGTADSHQRIVPQWRQSSLRVLGMATKHGPTLSLVVSLTVD